MGEDKSSRERFLQWTLLKLFLTAEVPEDRGLICFSKASVANRQTGL
jgi:hypothetical protein